MKNHHFLSIFFPKLLKLINLKPFQDGDHKYIEKEWFWLFDHRLESHIKVSKIKSSHWKECWKQQTISWLTSPPNLIQIPSWRKWKIIFWKRLFVTAEAVEKEIKTNLNPEKTHTDSSIPHLDWNRLLSLLGSSSCQTPKLLLRRLTPLTENNSLIKNYKFGFREKYSTVSFIISPISSKVCLVIFYHIDHALESLVWRFDPQTERHLIYLTERLEESNFKVSILI